MAETNAGVEKKLQQDGKVKKSAVIVSVRGSHMDGFPLDLLKHAILHVKKNYAELPVSFCFEIDPQFKDSNTDILENLKKHFKGLCDHGVSHSGNVRYSAEDLQNKEAHNLSMYWLLRSLQVKNVTFIPSDLAGISKISLGDSRAEALRPQREKTMADAILETANKRGGLVFDFGGDNHFPGLQALLSEQEEMQKKLHELHCFCAYSYEGQKYIPTNIRLMKFQGVSKEKYPLGLSFITTADELTQKSSPTEQDAVSAKVIKQFTDFLDAQLKDYFQKLSNSEENSEKHALIFSNIAQRALSSTPNLSDNTIGASNALKGNSSVQLNLS